MTHLTMNLDFHRGSEPPKTSGIYLVIAGKGGSIMGTSYSAKHGRFNCRDHDETPASSFKVRWWAVLPEWMSWASGGPRGEG